MAGSSPAVCRADDPQSSTRQADPEPVAVAVLGEVVEHDPADDGRHREGDGSHDADRHPVLVDRGDIGLG